LLDAKQLGATGGVRPVGVFSTGVRVDWGLSQRQVRIDCGLLYTTGQGTIMQGATMACNHNNAVAICLSGTDVAYCVKMAKPIFKK